MTESQVQKTADVQAEAHKRTSPISPLVIVLGALLAVQIAMAVVLGQRATGLDPIGSQGPLLVFDADEVTGLTIEPPEGDTLKLVKSEDDTWTLPALGDFPANVGKVQDLLSKLGEIQRGVPVATSPAAAERFKVAEDGFERRVVLEGDAGPLATVYLGDSPGFRRLFVRAEGEPAVYEAELGLFEASDKADNWADMTVLNLATDDIVGIGLGGLALSRDADGNWSAAVLAEGETLDTEAVEDTLRKLATVGYRAVLGPESKPEYGQDAPVLMLSVTLEGGDSYDYTLSQNTEDDSYVLKRSDRPHYFALSKFSGEDLAEIGRDALIRTEAESEDASTSGDEGTDDAASEGDAETPEARVEEPVTESAAEQ